MEATKAPLSAFAQFLLKRGLLSEQTIRHSLSKAQAVRLPLVFYLGQQQLLGAKQLAQLAAEFTNLPLVDISQFNLEQIPVCINEQFVKQHFILPLYIKNDQLHLAIADPLQLALLDQLKFVVAMPIHWVVVEHDKLVRAIANWLHQRNHQALMQVQATDTDHDQRIIRFVQQLLSDAIHKKASDIHIEPQQEGYQVRLRVDGILHHALHLTHELAARVVTRLKVMGKLDIGERRLPQDGRISIELEHQQACDCRISTCPTLLGEKIVLRILDTMEAALNLADLGFEDAQKQLLLKTLQRPQGMFLVTGPTGSGKTVSLYAALNYLNTISKNILTVEEPVEIQLAGISQVNVNLKIGLSFSNTLRAFLRQDPDIIMVGEIRDQETAEIAVKAAQTGHLVLSTLHTNSAAETLTRLTNMGVEAFNIAYSVSLIIAQRLVRKLCEHCKVVEDTSQENLLDNGFAVSELAELKVFKPVGCQDCYEGYRGRIGIFECLPINENIIRIIMAHGSSGEIAKAAQLQGMMTLREAGLNKVRAGITSLAEIRRVVAI